MSVSPASSARRPTVLITGPTTGIGFALAERFARDGFRMILVSRNLGRLEEAASRLGASDAILIASDLSEPGAARTLVQEVDGHGLSVDVLVNNAGFGAFGPFAEADPDETSRMLQLNVLALTELTRLLLPPMIERRSGRILNVASTAAFAPGPLMAVYYASKAYVLSFSDALANELQGTGVTVTSLCPGPTRTAFQERAGVEFSPLAGGIMTADAVAEAGYRGLMRGKPTVIPGLKNLLLTRAAAQTPRRLAAKIIRVMQEGKRREK